MCREFERDDSPWQHELINRCLVCKWFKECGSEDNSTSIMHGEVWHGGKSKVRGVLR